MFASIFGSLTMLLGFGVFVSIFGQSNADLDGRLYIIEAGFAGLVLIIVGGVILSSSRVE